ncbi:hypothetical protein APSETT445_008915 [Aspergillus pseudonomiae]
MLAFRAPVWRRISPTYGANYRRLANSFRFQVRRGICQLQSVDKFHKVRLRFQDDVKRGLEILVSILREPSRAEQLRELELDCTPCYMIRSDPYEIRPTQVLLPTEDLQRLQLAVRNAGFEERGEHERVLSMLLQDVSEDQGPYGKYLYFQAQALAVMFVSLAPRLESLAFCSLGLQHRLETYVFENFLQRAIAEKRDVPGLRNLRSVRFLDSIDSFMNGGTLYWDYDVHDCLNLIRELPAIESVRFDAIKPNLDVGTWPPPRSANYTDIMFYHCIIHMLYEELEVVIHSPKRLRKFAWTVGGRSERGGDITPISPVFTLECLLTHRHTLEELDLDIQGHAIFREMVDEDPMFRQDDDNDYYDNEDLDKWKAQKKEIVGVESPAPDCALRSFPNLKHLSLGTHVLYCYARGFGAGRLKEPFSLIDNLPPRLESLRLYGYGLPGELPHRCKDSLDLEVEAQIAALLEQKDSKLPSLKVIEGIDTPIPHGCSVEDCDRDPHLLWRREDDE